MKCGQRKCNGVAVCLATWGPLHNPEENRDQPLCEEHLEGLWVQVKSLVQTGKIHYQTKSVPEKSKEKFQQEREGLL